jgi:hypothetical protein
MIAERSPLWQVMSADEQQLARDGEVLLDDRLLHPNERLSDYSYLVFPFAKLYEGFLKQSLHTLHIIGDREYQSDHFRMGKALSPHMARTLGANSAYGRVQEQYGAALAEQLWVTWKQGRNLVFHYFPHNVRRLTQEEARELILMIIETMEQLVTVTHLVPPAL